jgi:hypothetical protein
MNRKELVAALKQLVIQRPDYRVVATPLASTWLSPEVRPALSFPTHRPGFNEIFKYIEEICDKLGIGYTISKVPVDGEILARWEFDLTRFDDVLDTTQHIEDMMRLLLPECRIKMHYQYNSTFTGLVVGMRDDCLQLNVIKDNNQMFYGEVRIRDIEDINLEHRWVALLPDAIISLTALERLQYM